MTPKQRLARLQKSLRLYNEVYDIVIADYAEQRITADYEQLAVIEQREDVVIAMAIMIQHLIEETEAANGTVHIEALRYQEKTESARKVFAKAGLAEAFEVLNRPLTTDPLFEARMYRQSLRNPDTGAPGDPA
jgi:hypothetical protein